MGEGFVQFLVEDLADGVAGWGEDGGGGGFEGCERVEVTDKKR